MPDRCFTPGTESQWALSASAFLDKAPDAVWIDDETTKESLSRISPQNFNKLTEGSYRGYVAVKGGRQRMLMWTGFTILMSNYSHQHIMSNNSIEFECRFRIYKFKKPDHIERGKCIPGAHQLLDSIAVNTGTW